MTKADSWALLTIVFPYRGKGVEAGCVLERARMH